MADYIKSHIGMEWRGIPIKYYENKRYLETNNIVSLYKATLMCFTYQWDCFSCKQINTG